MAEALVLDTRASPPADLPREAVPEGWTLRWLAPGLPMSAPDAGDDITTWTVDVSVGGGACVVEVSPATDADAPVLAEASPGDRLTTVHGQDALVAGWLARWNEPSGARVTVYCLPGYDGIVDLAESLAPAAADDSRIPVGGG